MVIIMVNIKNISDDFPILAQKINGHRFVYLDSAATSMRPNFVLDRIDAFYKSSAANPHRGVYALAERATAAYEGARAAVARFVGADTDEIVFTRNASESLNIVMYCHAQYALKPGDSVVIPISEHHSNLVPWQIAAAKTGAELRYLYTDAETGLIPDSEIERKIDKTTKIVAFAHVSNVLGLRFPAEKLVARARCVGAVTVLDAAQSVPHFPVDFHGLDVDFAAFSAHKMYGPMGIGVLYGRRELLEKMPPFLFGGDMIEYVREQDTDFAAPPHRFEAGTQNAGGAVGLAAAVEYIGAIGWANIESREAALMRRLTAGLAEQKRVSVIGDADPGARRYGVVSFNIEDVHSHDAATILDSFGIAIRAGAHCAHPLLDYLGVKASCRASLGVYSTEQDIDRLLECIPQVRRKLGYGD
ncbi:MAG: SufS family cysteine desulfurase [Oscillospiraceae bacterium]|jgi:cysteine desulfurase/selenocysteine lyase|nr:SufS family cysteine desulfurase [Oscillospiraceae bacterium]